MIDTLTIFSILPLECDVSNFRPCLDLDIDFYQCPGRTRHLTKSAAGHVLGLPNTTTPDFNFAACR